MTLAFDLRPPKFELEQDFGTVQLIAKFHHRMFNRSEVIVLTNRQTKLTDKQTDAAETSNSLRYATPMDN